MRMSLVREAGLGDAAGDAVQFHADELIILRGIAHEIPDAAAGFQDEGVCRHAEACQAPSYMACITAGR